MFNPSTYQVARSSVIHDLTPQTCPVAFIEQLITEFDENAAVIDFDQKVELYACLAALHARKGDWQEFEVQMDRIDHLGGKRVQGLVCETLLSLFFHAEKLHTQQNDSVGLRALLTRGAQCLESADASWPQSGEYLAQKCLQHRDIARALQNDTVDTFIKSLEINFSPILWNSINNLQSIVSGEIVADPEDNLIENDSFRNQHSQGNNHGELLDLDDYFSDYKPTSFTQLASGLYSIVEGISQLKKVSPIEGAEMDKSFQSIIAQLPVWRDTEISTLMLQGNDVSTAENIFVNECLDVYSALLSVVCEFTVKGKDAQARTALQNLHSLSPDNPISYFEDPVSLARIQIGVMLLMQKLQLSELAEFTKKEADSFKIISHGSLIDAKFEASDLSQILIAYAVGWMNMWLGSQPENLAENTFAFRPVDKEVLPSAKLVVGRMNQFVKSSEIRTFLRTIAISRGELDPEDAELLENVSTIFNHLAEFHQTLGDERRSALYHQRFLKTATIILQRTGVNPDDYDEEGPASLFLSSFEQLVAKGELKSARQYADTFYESLFLSPVHLALPNLLDNLGMASYGESSDEKTEEDEADRVHGGVSIDVKQRFMKICAMAGFFDLTRDSYFSVLDEIKNDQEQFMHLLELAGSLRV